MRETDASSVCSCIDGNRVIAHSDKGIIVLQTLHRETHQYIDTEMDMSRLHDHVSQRKSRDKTNIAHSMASSLLCNVNDLS